MWKQNWVIGLCIASCFAGMSHHWQRANAAGVQPPPCPQFMCKNITYYWAGDKGFIKAYLASGGQALAVYGITDLYTGSPSTFDKPTGGTGNWVDLYQSPSCMPTCGQDGNGVWLAPQEVINNGMIKVLQPGVGQLSCTRLPEGQIGPINKDATNNNPDKNSPPSGT